MLRAGRRRPEMAGAVSNCQPDVAAIVPTLVKLSVSEVSNSSGLMVKFVKMMLMELLLTKFSASIMGGTSGGAETTPQLTQVSAGWAGAAHASSRPKRVATDLRFICRICGGLGQFMRSGRNHKCIKTIVDPAGRI